MNPRSDATEPSTARTQPALQRIFHDKLVTAETALAAVKSGDHVYVHPGCATPERLLDAMVARAGELEGVRSFT